MKIEKLKNAVSALHSNLSQAALGFAFVLVVATPAHAAVDMFAKVDTIRGESNDATHKDEIDILSYTLAASRNGPNGSLLFDELFFSHNYDKASPLLFQTNVRGTHLQKVDLTFRKAGDKPINFLTFTLSDVVVTSIRQGEGSGDDRGTETVGLRFSKINMKYWMQNAQGAAVAAGDVTYDLVTGK